ETDPLFDISTLELERRGPSYTYDTLVSLRARIDEATELMWIIGMDMLAELPNWYRVADVLALARLVTVARHPMPDNLDAVLAELRKSSFGFRPNRSAHGAAKQVQRIIRQGHTHCVDVDWSKFFDRVQHDVVMRCPTNGWSNKDCFR
ncbi:MAG: reverse transcriptase domain-containing protein, partial [Pirellulaceae bacterium]